MNAGATSAAAKAVKSAPQPGVFKRLLELLMMLVSAFLVVFAWDTASKAQEESAQLRDELRRAKGEQLDRSGTRCTVCLDNPREVLLQSCGHVCMCKDCADRVRKGDNQCPICRKQIDKMQPAFIS
eukprot:GFUD01027066.1.p2 GENE.GFUD01027066.1~~GFUD01027066.1.p2  ORF type:complete len:126 (-),score=47.03 GFUD01027066.1:409-786(-)